MLSAVFKRAHASYKSPVSAVRQSHRRTFVFGNIPGRLAKLLVFASLMWISMFSHASELPPLTGEVLLTIEGNLSESNADESLQVDLAMLESLPLVAFKTETPWTEGVTEWEGVRLNDFLKYIGAGSDRFIASALDEYEILFENVDLEKYPVILAYKQNGDYMTVRGLGPLWIMFPFADFPELDVQFNRALSIWQLIRMEIL